MDGDGAVSTSAVRPISDRHPALNENDRIEAPTSRVRMALSSSTPTETPWSGTGLVQKVSLVAANLPRRAALPLKIRSKVTSCCRSTVGSESWTGPLRSVSTLSTIVPPSAVTSPVT